MVRLAGCSDCQKRMAWKILILDPCPMFRRGLRTVIESQPNMKVIGDSSDASVAVKLAADLRPHLAAVDIDSPALQGFHFISEVRERGLMPEILAISHFLDGNICRRAFEAGVRGFLLRDAVEREILNVFQELLQGKEYIPPKIAEFLAPGTLACASSQSNFEHVDRLTPAEKRILKKVSEGKSSKEISGEMKVSPKTVENHRNSISSKLGLQGSHSLVRFACEQKVLLSSCLGQV